MKTSVFSDNLIVSKPADLYNFEFGKFEMTFENNSEVGCIRRSVILLPWLKQHVIKLVGDLRQVSGFLNQ
jgi:hypothetical protein